jgi:hypothetical protein
MARKPLTEQVHCPECGTETMKPDPLCSCKGWGVVIRKVVCPCCFENHHGNTCPFYCKDCGTHHETGQHTV